MGGGGDAQAQQQHEQQEGQRQEGSDGGVRPPALDRVSIASAIGDQMPKLSRCAMHAVSLPCRLFNKLPDECWNLSHLASHSRAVCLGQGTKIVTTAVLLWCSVGLYRPSAGPS